MDHLRDFAPNLEKYKAVQISPILKDKIETIAIFVGNFIPYIEIIVNLKPKVGPNTLPLSRICHNCLNLALKFEHVSWHS
jgi:hypothetical protein